MAETAEAVAKGAFEGGKEAAWELLDIFFEWILPIVMLVVGYLLSAELGLSGVLGTVVDGATNGSVSGAAQILVSDLIAAAIWGSIAGALWSAQTRGGRIGKFIMRPLSTLFGGFALGEIGAAISGKVLNGQLGTMSTNLETKLAAVG